MHLAAMEKPGVLGALWDWMLVTVGVRNAAGLKTL